MARPEAASAPPFNSTDPQNIDQPESHSQIPNAQIFQHQSSQNNPDVPMQPVQFPSMVHQPSQYPNQPIPSNIHFHSVNIQSNPQPAPRYVPVHQVPFQQPSIVYVPNVNTVAWTTGLFDCFDDPLNALVTLCIPCLTFGQVAEIVDSGSTSCAVSGLIYGAIACIFGCPCFLSCTYRTKLRSRYYLVESPAPDWITHCLCEYCALCQEYRELQNRGLDPSIGWHGNVVRSHNMQMYQTEFTYEVLELSSLVKFMKNVSVTDIGKLDRLS
ncbi:protein PLANT CADMIUM RESISTANCE 6-like [Pistacia vera]|uniref:protein PLANT CADMIUM RESISTANCE 6-like n=1 Tax=Pistacia vera TaxID=55513 RepID=UPI0012637BC2|nr:protein PLANT CADMIUM RESISTANCE 6-like [Pistacia vera]